VGIPLNAILPMLSQAPRSGNAAYPRPAWRTKLLQSANGRWGDKDLMRGRLTFDFTITPFAFAAHGLSAGRSRMGSLPPGIEHASFPANPWRERLRPTVFGLVERFISAKTCCEHAVVDRSLATTPRPRSWFASRSARRSRP